MNVAILALRTFMIHCRVCCLKQQNALSNRLFGRFSTFLQLGLRCQMQLLSTGVCLVLARRQTFKQTCFNFTLACLSASWYASATCGNFRSLRISAGQIGFLAILKISGVFAVKFLCWLQAY